MKINHVALYVNDIDESLKLYRDIFGFQPIWDREFPDEALGQDMVDANFGIKGARIRNCFALSPSGDKLEFVQPLSPEPRRTARGDLGYPNTGMQELAFDVTEIDSWLEKIKAAGYEPHTDFVWEIPGVLRSFLFRDVDGNAVQLVEELISLTAAAAQS